MYPSLNYCKGQAENIAIEENKEIPEGFTITWNEATQQAGMFVSAKAYADQARPEDKIVSRWKNGKWEDWD